MIYLVENFYSIFSSLIICSYTIGSGAVGVKYYIMKAKSDEKKKVIEK